MPARAGPPAPPVNCTGHLEKTMGQRIESSFVCEGRYRIHTVEAVGRQPARIIEIEEVDTRERHHGSPKKLRRLLAKLRHSHDDSLSL